MESHYSPKMKTVILGISLFSENEDRYSWYLVILRKAGPLFLESPYSLKMNTALFLESRFLRK